MHSSFCVSSRTSVSMWDGLSRPASVRSRLTVDCVCFLSTGMAAAVRLPAFCRPQNVSAALRSGHAVCYRCHAAPLRPQCHGDAGQQHDRVSHVLFHRFEGAARELVRSSPGTFEQKLSLGQISHRGFISELP